VSAAPNLDILYRPQPPATAYRLTHLAIAVATFTTASPALGTIDFPGRSGSLLVDPDTTRRPDVGGPTPADLALPELIPFRYFERVFRRA